MSQVIQNIFIFFSLIGISHTFILILSNIQDKNDFRLSVKQELVGLGIIIVKK